MRKVTKAKPEKLPDVLKTIFDSGRKTWKYAIRGKTLEDLDVRVIVAFDDDGMLVITVMHVGGL